MNKKILKTITCIGLVLSMLINVSPVYASGDSVVIPKFPEYDKDKYPYSLVMVLNATNPNDPDCKGFSWCADYAVNFVVSENPIIVYGNESNYYVKNSLYSGGYYNVNNPNQAHVSTVDYNVYSFKFGAVQGNPNLIYRVSSAYDPKIVYFNANHDIYLDNGDKFLDKTEEPTPPPVTPDTSWTASLGSVFLRTILAVIGGMICLMGFWLLLRRLARWLNQLVKA